MNPLKSVNLLSGALAFAALGALTLPAHAGVLPTRSCAYDPSSGKPNPLAGKAFVSINEIDGDTVFTYQPLPTKLNQNSTRAVVAQQRELTLEDVPLEEGRQLLASNAAYYSELLGYDSSTGFGPVNESLTCWSNADSDSTGSPLRSQGFSTTPNAGASPQTVLADPRPAFVKPNKTASSSAGAGTPEAGTPPPIVQTQATTQTPVPPPTRPPAPTTTAAVSSPRKNSIASLPDGAYRFWNGKTDTPEVSDDRLLKEGGVLFIFRKQGDRITGNFAYIDGEDSACVFGFANRDTVSGFAYPYSNTVQDVKEVFVNLGPANFLRVRRASKTGNVNFYRSALLDLKDFNQINLGPVLPPKNCQA
ncbi:MAG: hypothetical protein HC771_00145 [Synechococcales cyanobacterium CRU_2_2]|nr:hypothetical protein [Synechococcales cyanobacterium CRU_2_2]